MTVETTNISSRDSGFVRRLVSALVGFLSRILLAVAFILIVTPIALVRRILGNDPMYRYFSDDHSYRRPSKKTPNKRLEKTY